MSWYYAKDNQQLGPVDQGVLLRLLQDGFITQQTLVWREGMSEWQPFNKVEALANTATTPNPTPLAAMPATTTTPNAEGLQSCPTCSSQVLPEFLIPYGGTQVCPDCKDDYVQRLKEGALENKSTWTGGTGGQTPNNELRAQARNALSGQWGDGVLFGFLYMLLNWGISLIGIIPIPFLSNIVSFIVTGPLSVGYCTFWTRFSRNQDTRNGMMFDGFSIFGKALGTYVIFALILFGFALLASIPGGIALAILQPWAIDNPDPAHIGIIVLTFLIPLTITLLIVSFQYSQIFFILTDDPDVGIMESLDRSKNMMKDKKMKYFWLNFVFILLYIVAGIAFIIPILWVIPYHWISLACFYNDLQEPSGTPQNTL